LLVPLSHGAGLLLNNQMDDFSTPGRPNVYGISPSQANFIRCRAGWKGASWQQLLRRSGFRWLGLQHHKARSAFSARGGITSYPPALL
jgi:hypothetical protein